MGTGGESKDPLPILPFGSLCSVKVVETVHRRGAVPIPSHHIHEVPLTNIRKVNPFLRNNKHFIVLISFQYGMVGYM